MGGRPVIVEKSEGAGGGFHLREVSQTLQSCFFFFLSPKSRRIRGGGQIG